MGGYTITLGFGTGGGLRPAGFKSGGRRYSDPPGLSARTPIGRFNHIIDPTRLICADPDRSVTVLADSAAVADGLSTLGALVPDPRGDLLPHLKREGARAYVISGTEERGIWLV